MKIKNLLVLGLLLVALIQGVAAENNTSALDTFINTLTSYLWYIILGVFLILALLIVAKMFSKSGDK